MRYIYFILILFLFAAPGCLESSYKETSASELLLNPEFFEGKKICIDGVIENNSIYGILIESSENFTGDYKKNGVLATVCGVYHRDRISADVVDCILIISTGKDIYRSNETMKVHVDIASEKDRKAVIGISGMKNAFDRALINETRDVILKKGLNGFYFEFKTPACEECFALTPGIYTINASVHIGGKTLETYKKITLEREK